VTIGGRNRIGGNLTVPRRRVVRAIAIAAVVGGVLLSGASPAVAAVANNGKWAVFPISGDGPTRRTNFSYNLSPGDSITDDVTVANLTDKPIHFAVYSADAYNTGSAAALAVRTRRDERTDASQWVSFPGSTPTEIGITVEPKRQVNLPFRISVPRNASPGDHSGGIAALDTETDLKKDGTASVAVENAVAVPVFVRVSGPTEPSLDVRFARVHSSPPVAVVAGGGSTSAEFAVVNDGNLRLRPVVRVSIKDAFGRTIHRFPEHTLGVLLPGGKAVLHEKWSGAGPFGWESVDVSVRADGVDLTRSHDVRPVPWTLVVLALTVGGAWIVWRRRRRRRTAAAPQRDSAAPLVRSARS